MIAVQISMTERGSVFDGRADQLVDDYIVELEKELAQAGVNLVKAELHQVLQNPSGYYESQVMTDRSFDDRSVTDNDVIYGPWLEGVGSRNAETRFKGYSTFRRMAQKLEGDADQIAQVVLPPFLKRMNDGS